MKDADPRSQRYIEEHAPLCASMGWTAAQVWAYSLALVGLAMPFWVFPYAALVAYSYGLAVFFLILVAFRLLAVLVGLLADPSRRVSPAALAALRDADLPVYSVLVPLYREPEIVEQLVAAIGALDYPVEKLDVQLLVEPDDRATLDVLQHTSLPAHFRLTMSPVGPPRTKPRACNEGLARARGELLVIYDAEDRPEPDQLRKAAAVYREAPGEVVCLQARLAHYNSRQSIFAQWSAMEYLVWFRFALPGLQRLGAPIPLGGTSNHFRVRALRELGGWDPFNVTEDCDLGMRIARRGWHVWMLNSTTWEEAVTGAGAWLRQRSRWIKGYWQTWMVHGRGDALREFGPWRWMVFALLTGAGTLTMVLNPIMWATIGAWLAFGWPLVELSNPVSRIMLVATLLLMAGNLAFLGLNMAACLLCRRPDLVLAALLSPFVWVLHSVAAWLALAQSVARPFHWEKTRHGHGTHDRVQTPVRGFFARVVAPSVAFGVLAAACLGATQAIQGRLDEQAAAQERERREKAERIRAHQIVWENLRYGRVQRPPMFEVDCYTGAAPLWDFSSDTQGWYRSAGLKGYALACDRMTTATATRALAVPLSLPGEADTVIHPDADWTRYGGLAFDCFLPADAPKGIQAIFYLRDRDDLWYEHLSTQTLLVGQTTRLEVDLDGRLHDWQPRGHGKAWDGYTPQSVRTLGVRFLGRDPYRGPVFLERVRALPRSHVLALRRALPVISEVRVASSTLSVLGRFEAAFQVGKVYENPYDPAQVDIRGLFQPPEAGAPALEAPAFYWQDFARSEVEGREVLTPVGRASWKVRFAPPRAGDWQFRLALRDAEGHTTETASQLFTVTDAPSPGFLRVAEGNPRYFSYADGSFFYPIGHNVCFPVDMLQAYPYEFPLPWGRKTYFYDEVFERMGAAGENWVRLWMTPWGVGIEGPPQWTEFHGVGRYNMANAWRLDHLIDEAVRRGLKVCLTMGHYSEYSQSWRYNQFNRANGGFLDDPAQLFTDPRAIRAFENRLRYIVARWGYSPQVMAWELWGEVNLAPGFEPNTVAGWHQRMIEHIGSLDAFGHMVFTHCHNWQRGHELWALPGIRIVQGNGYIRPPNNTENHIINFRRYLSEVERYPKPVLVAEYGGRSERGAPSRDYLEAQLHSGLWASFVQPFGGTAMHWWWNFIEGENLYGHYAALARFAEGIDRLKRDYRSVTPRLEKDGVVLRPQGEGFAARGRSRGIGRMLSRLVGPAQPRGGHVEVAGMQADNAGFYWAYHPMAFVTCRNVPPTEGLTMTLEGLLPGRYRVELWDTDAGRVTGERMLDVSGATPLLLPRMERDLAIKVLPLE